MKHQVYEITSAVMKSNKNVDSLRIFDNEFLHAAYADNISLK